jgi:hypothetical protein
MIEATRKNHIPWKKIPMAEYDRNSVTLDDRLYEGLQRVTIPWQIQSSPNLRSEGLR